MVEVSVCGICKLQGPEADVVQSLIVNAEGFIGVLNQLMNGQRCVVRLQHHIRNLKVQRTIPAEAIISKRI